MIRLRSIVDGWNRFFFQPESPLPIAVYRILLGLLILTSQLLLYPDLGAFFYESGMLSSETAKNTSGGRGFNLFDYIGTSDGSVQLIFWLSIVSALMFTVGLWTRPSAAVLFLCLLTMNHRNPVLLNSGDSFLRIALFFTIFSHAGAALSVDRYIRVRRGKEDPERPPLMAPWAMRLIQLQLAFLYFYAFVWKMMGPMWVSGMALYYTSRLPEFFRFPTPYIFEHVWTIKLWTWGTLVIEFALGVLVWVKELRYWVLLAGVLLHLGIDYTMNIPLFGFTMVAAYVTFVDPKDLERVLNRASAKIRRRGSREKIAPPRVAEEPAPEPGSAAV